MVTTIPVRSVLERLGYRVDYDENTGIIRITDPATGRTGTISPGSYELRQNRTYINPQHIASLVRPGLPSAAVAAYTMLDQIPSMNEVIAKAQADYEAARSRNDTLAMERAQQAMNAARAVGNIIGYDVRPADALNPIKRAPSGGAFFDPVTYMWQAALSLPWAPGTPTMTERKMAHEKELEEMKQRHQKELESIKSSNRASQLSTSEAKALAKGMYQNIVKKAIDRAWAEGGWAKAVEALRGLEAEIWAEAPEMTKAGVDPQDIIDYAYQLVGGFEKKGNKWELQQPTPKSGGMGTFKAMFEQ